MSATGRTGRRIAIAAGIATVIAGAVAGASGAGERHAESPHAMPATAPAEQVAFHDAMRKLWEDHVTWTRLAIVGLVNDLPDLPATQARLMRNQADIGNAVKPYYGRAAGNQLTKLLEQHIGGAVAILQAAKSGDQALTALRVADWHANGDAIGDFLHAANPRQWPRKEMRHMMRIHLDETVDEAVHMLQGHHVASIHDYDRIHRHILRMADALSGGIVAQFPRRFR